jgi:diguanylate cyclase (GGDEF)-like protein
MNIVRDLPPLADDGLGLVHRNLDWLLSGTDARSAEVHAQLLQHGQLGRSTLVILTLSMSLIASTAIALTGESWAWAWLLAELLIGAAKLSAQNSVEKAVHAGKMPSITGLIVAGLSGAIVLGIAGYQSVASGNMVLIVLCGISLAGMIGGASVRGAGTPRYTVALMSLMGLPYAFATLHSSIPSLYLVGLQAPILLVGLIVSLHANYKKLVVLHLAQQQNRWLAHHDILTGLPNRTMELKYFDELLRRQATDPDAMPTFTVLCLDLDGFKDVNDGYGHEAGDAVLVAVARRLKNCIRDIDFLFRVGGDEFVILLPALTPDAASIIAHRIIDRISLPLDVGRDTKVRIGISIGGACAPADGTTADELLRSADRAMYEAKRRGKGIYVTLPVVDEVVELFPSACPADVLAPTAG